MTKDELLRRVVNDIEKIYPAGLYEFLYKRRPELDSRLVRVWAGIDSAYLNDSVSIADFKAVLREYWTVHTLGIREFKEERSDFNLSGARRERDKERVRA